MKLDFFKCVDLLMVAFVALAWSQVCIAQPAGKFSGTPQEKAAQKANQAQYRSRQALVEHCEREAKAAQGASVKHPAKVMPYPLAYKKCMELRK